MPEQQLRWFAARTKKDQELSLRSSLEKLGVEHFIPTQFVIRQWKDRKRRIEVPLIRNLIFVRATKERACSLANDDGLHLYYIKDLQTRSMLVVPDKQMDDFMFVLNLSPESLYLDDSAFTIGARVQVVKGDFCGIEGELISLPNRTYVVIRILDVLAVKVKVPKSYLHILPKQ